MIDLLMAGALIVGGGCKARQAALNTAAPFPEKRKCAGAENPQDPLTSLPMCNTDPAVTRSRAVAVTEQAHAELARLSAKYGKSRRQIVTEAIAAYQAVRELEDAGRPAKETRPWSSSDTCSVELRSPSQRSPRSHPSGRTSTSERRETKPEPRRRGRRSA